MPLSQNFRDRFSGIARLYGEHALDLLSQAHFVVIGLGGVGSWAAEALARTGIGELTLIELDDVCVSNTNRQSHALTSNIGKPKNTVISERLNDINPDLKLHQIDAFLHRNNLAELIHPRHHVVIDAMDAAHNKAALIAYCRARKIRLITVGSSGGKRDPSKIRVADLGRTEFDPMLAKIRGQLYRHHNFSRDTKRKFRVDAVYSIEHRVYPQGDGSVCTAKNAMQEGSRLDCASGFGAVTMVTGTFGFTAASRAVERYLSDSAREQ